ncbi:MAG: helix-turn-helix transcriptional regulator [Ignavibacteriae bacterium]|nr:helix-turn-helix transcriptional regulator [Ignavibacteriota bacterium]
MEINRLKVVLAEKRKKNIWLANQIGRNQTTISQWCTNQRQPSLETLHKIAKILDVDVRLLLISTKNDIK